jgi:ABC-type transport system involved in cytochrome bd biosynthesis fused ATPase/permease subunit
MVEAEIFGYGDQYIKTLNSTAENLAQLEKINFRRTSLLQLLVIATIGSTLLALIWQLSLADDLLPIQVSMAIFLAMVGFEGYTSWFPNLFPAGKNRRAATTVESIARVRRAETGSKPSPKNFDLEGREVSPYWQDKFLTPINFNLPTGQTLVISGASGTGKSTFAAALFGFAQYSGSLTIGGIEISEIDEISQYLTGTLQNGYIFNTTLRENLKIAKPDATDAELIELISALELERIDLDETLGEFGRVISGGEAKRLSIARALLSPAPILILDEPLEHLDFERAQRIQAIITERAHERTLIVITHSPWLQYSRKLELARE